MNKNVDSEAVAIVQSQEAEKTHKELVYVSPRATVLKFSRNSSTVLGNCTYYNPTPTAAVC